MAKTTAELKKQIISLAEEASKLSERVHALACDVLLHYTTPAEENGGNGDTSLAALMIQTFWKTGVHRRALIQWFEDHGGMRWDTDKFLKKKNFDVTDVDHDKAKVSPFYANDDAMGRTEADATPFNAVKAIAKVLKTQSDIQAGTSKRNTDVENSVFLEDEVFSYLTDMVGMLEGKETKETGLMDKIEASVEGKAA